MSADCDDVIRTKLSAPSLPVALVSRARLLSRLDAPARFVLVSAPAGFGKTALILDWLHQRQSQAAWLSVDRYDNDPTRFFRHLNIALASLPAGGGVLVLDDVHELEDTTALAAVERLLDPNGRGPRVILLSRTDPPFSLGRIRLTGQLLELRERDLRFTFDECRRLFDVLDDSLVHVLEARTEGWAAGLRMAAIALQDSPDPAAAIRSFAGTSRIVVDYLLEEAVEKQSAQVQQFLLDTSVLQRFTAETCVAVTEDSAAAGRLAEIEAANLFLVPLGPERRWFRYHHLFRELLEFRLHRSSPERVQLLHARAARWFEQSGDINSAIEHASELKDPQLLLELLDRYGMEVVVRSELATVARWLEHVPVALTCRYPVLLVVRGWMRILTERSPDLGEILGAIESALALAGDDYDPAQRERARVQLGVLRGFAARFAGRLEEALEINAATLAELPANDAFSRGLVVYNQARLHMIFGDMMPAAQLLEAGFNDHVRTGTLYLMLTGLGQAASVCAQLEGVHRARERIRSAVAFAEKQNYTSLPAYSAILYHGANVDFIADALGDAMVASRQAFELGSASNFPEGEANGLLLLARIAIAGQRFADADAALTELAALEQSRNITLMDTTVALERIRLALMREVRGAGPIVAAVEEPDARTRWTLVKETQALLALQQALRHDAARAAVLAQRLADESRERGRGVAWCAALMAQAMLADDAARWQILDEALTFAAARGYVRPLLDFGEPLRALLAAAQSRPLSPAARGHARLLLDKLEAPSVTAAQLTEPLTAREDEVLRYLFADLSNKAIARSMFVSAETVKTHLKHLYGKLGAANRQQAMARARELGLTPKSPDSISIG